MSEKKPYSGLAPWFEYLNDDCDYEKWSQYLITRLEPFHPSVGLDVGCGGGYFTRAFQKRGWQTTGLDSSAEMLDFAQTKAAKEGVRGEYLLGDITSIKLPRRFDFATAINDLVNYIPKTKLRSAFKSVAAALKKDGVFLFDVSSERKFREKIANTVSVDDREEVTYLAFNSVDGDVATLDVTVFSRRSDGAFNRSDERHIQYIYGETELRSALEETGFEVLSVEGHLGEDKKLSDRLCFLARRR